MKTSFDYREINKYYLLYVRYLYVERCRD